jgi:hypothetical protein
MVQPPLGSSTVIYHWWYRGLPILHLLTVASADIMDSGQCNNNVFM